MVLSVFAGLRNAPLGEKVCFRLDVSLDVIRDQVAIGLGQAVWRDWVRFCRGLNEVQASAAGVVGLRNEPTFRGFLGHFGGLGQDELTAPSFGNLDAPAVLEHFAG